MQSRSCQISFQRFEQIRIISDLVEVGRTEVSLKLSPVRVDKSIGCPRVYFLRYAEATNTVQRYQIAPVVGFLKT